MSNLDTIYDYKKEEFISWNPVFNFVMELKYRYFGYFGRFDYSKSDNMVQYWANALNDAGVTKYADVLKYVKVIAYNELVLFKYNIIAVHNDKGYPDEEDTGITITDLWSMYDGFYRECRGVVIDILNDMLVITPFEKFFNLNEIEETMYDNIIEYMTKNGITMNDLEITEKIDGCIISVRYYNGRTYISGSGSLDPEINHVIGWVDEYIHHNDNISKMIRCGNDSGFMRTYMFECICPLETHVVEYSEDQYGLYLIGIRDVKYGFTLNYDSVIKTAEYYGVKTTKMYKDYTLDDLIAKMDDSVGSTREGFVVNIDQVTGFRIKIKYSDYVQLSAIMNNLSRNNIVKYVYNNELDDIKSILRTKNKLIILEEIGRCESIISDYERIYKRLVELYYSKVDEMARFGSDIVTIMNYINTLNPKYVRQDVINIYKGNYAYLKEAHYQLIKPASRKSQDIGYLTFDTIVERLEEMKEILRKETVCEPLEGGVEHDL